jgi:hypothetical protein
MNEHRGTDINSIKYDFAKKYEYTKRIGYDAKIISVIRLSSKLINNLPYFLLQIESDIC